MITERILEYLQTAEDYLSADYLAQELIVSKRTIQNKVHLLNTEGRENGFKINSVYGKGYYLEIVDKTRYSKLLKQIASEKYINNEKELISNELRLLLLSGSHYITVHKLSQALNLSDTYLYDKLNNLQRYLSLYGINLKRKSHYGLKITGAENNIIQLIFDLYDRKNGLVYEYVDRAVGNIDWIKAKIKDYIIREDYKINFYEYQSLIIWIKSFIFFKKNFKDNQYKSNKDSKITSFSSKLLKDIAKQYDLKITNTEFFNFNYKYNEIFSSSRNTSKVDLSEIKKSLTDFIKKVDTRDHTNLLADKVFISKLAHHVDSLFDRMNKNISYKNPLLLEISVRYPEVFDLSLQFSAFIKSRFKFEITNDELGFIALYFLNNIENQKNTKLGTYKKIAVICTSGGGISELTKTRITRILPNATITTFPFYDTDKIADFNADLILTMIPLSNGYHVPTILINELLSDQDLDEIKKALFLDNVSSFNTIHKSFNKEYLKLFSSEFISKYSGQDYMSILQQMTIPLIERGYSSQKLTQNVLQREKYMSTVYKNGLAIPHPIKMDAKRSVISVGIPKNELIIHDKFVKLIFLISLAERDACYYSTISNDLYRLMNDKEKINQILQHPDIKTIQKVFRTIGD